MGSVALSPPAHLAFWGLRGGCLPPDCENKKWHLPEHCVWDRVRLVEFGALWVGNDPAKLQHGRAWTTQCEGDGAGGE